MLEYLTVFLKLSIIGFLVTAMLKIGTSLTLRQILEPLRNTRLVLTFLGVSYILVPLAAIVIAKVIQLEQPLRIGLVLLSMTAGAEAGPIVVGIARGNIAFSVAMLSVQLVVTIIYVPMVVSLLLPEVNIDQGNLLLKLLVLVLLPMLLGLFLKARYDAIAERLKHIMHRVSTVFLFLMITLIITLNFSEIIRLIGSGAILASVIFVIIAFIIGYLLGGPGNGNRQALGFMSGARNASISLMIASQVFNDPDVMLMITLTGIMMLIILLPTAFWFSRRNVT